VNPFAAAMLSSLRFDLAFIGCNGIHPQHGVTNVNLPEAEIKTLALRSARRAVLVADGSKLLRTDAAVIGAVSEFAQLVTAGPAEPGAIEALRSAGLDVLRA
jgi:DeoR family transcriptional regulator of aga operon